MPATGITRANNEYPRRFVHTNGGVIANEA